jgi:hypothetical protein
MHHIVSEVLSNWLTDWMNKSFLSSKETMQTYFCKVTAVTITTDVKEIPQPNSRRPSHGSTTLHFGGGEIVNAKFYVSLSPGRSRDSAIGIATGYGLDDQVVGVRVPVGSRIFSSPRPPNLLSDEYGGGSFGGGKAAGEWSWPLTSS